MTQVPLAKVRHRRGEEHLEVVGLGKVLPTDAGLVANRAVLEPAGLTSLRTALQSYEYSWGAFDSVHVTNDREDLIDDDSHLDEVSLVFRDGQLLASAFVAVVEGTPEEAVVRSLAAPTLEREGIGIEQVQIFKEKWGWAVWLTLDIPIKRRSVGDALRKADLISGVIQGAYPEHFDVKSAASVVQARHPELLAGTFESDWLDAKSSPYRLDKKAQQYELAKDVAAFANSGGGLILIGAKTKRRPGGDEIHSINGCALSDGVAAEMRSVIRRRVYPRIDKVSVEMIPMSSPESGVILIQIPPQLDGQKPYLVVGTRSGDQISELGFTYAVRDGETTDAPRIEVVHQLIRAGASVLGGGASPEIESLRADVERLEAANWEGWVSDIVLAAIRNGFHVERDGDRIEFKRGDSEPLVVQATAPAPPADLLLRQQLLEQLEERGLPVKKTPRGMLQPLLD